MIRKLEERDREQYLTMAGEFYRSPAVASDIPGEYLTRGFEELMKSDTYLACYVDDDGAGRLRGYLQLAKTYSQEGGGMVWWLEEIWVEPAFRNQKIGTGLIRYVQGIRPKEVTRLRLEIEPENEKAVRLYRSLGFGDWPYGEMAAEYPIK